jgi:SAM-dependent methyltransferase
MNQSQPSNRWAAYYQAVANNPPRDTLRRALTLFGTDYTRPISRRAIDLGCGAGVDTLELLRQGWQVLAIDRNPEAITWLTQRVSPADQPRLTTRTAAFETVELPPVELINASHSLPFCPPEQFETFWQKITTALQSGGRLAGHFFGDRDGWAARPTMTFHSALDIQQRLHCFEIEYLDEQEHQGTTALGEPKYWHLFSVVARKR